jgi:hypothetical protein
LLYLGPNGNGNGKLLKIPGRLVKFSYSYLTMSCIRLIINVRLFQVELENMGTKYLWTICTVHKVAGGIVCKQIVCRTAIHTEILW